MNIIDNINNKVQSLVSLGLTDEHKVRKALSFALDNNPNHNQNVILHQQYVLMLEQFNSGSTEYCLED